MEERVSSENGLRLEGFVQVELINKKDRVKRVYKNTITNAGKQFLLDKSAQQMLNMSTEMFGRAMASGIITHKINSDITGRVAYQNRDITNVIMNLGDDVVLSGNTTCINVWDENFTTADKLVGYANNNATPASNGKEGAIDFEKGEYVVDPYTVAKRWRYDPGVASGQIDTIAMMPAGCIKTPQGDGVRFMKCLDQMDFQVNQSESANGFLPPGVPGYTANDEILLNYTQGTKGSRWKFNLTTGEVTAVASGDAFFTVNNVISSSRYLMDIYIEGNYMYVLRTGSSVSSGGGNLYFYVYDLTQSPSPNELGYYSMSFSTAIYFAKFIKVGDNLYVTVMNDSTNAGNIQMFTLTKSGNYWNGVGASATDYSALGVTLPTGIDINDICFGNYGSNYVMYLKIKVDGLTETENKKGTGYKAKGYVFGALTDLDPDSAIECIYGVNPNSVLWSAGSNSGILQVGFDFWNSYGSTSRFAQGQVYDLFDSIFNVTTNITNYEQTMCSKGVFLSLDGWWTNAISYVRLQTPVVKGDDDVMYVSYGYKVV